MDVSRPTQAAVRRRDSAAKTLQTVETELRILDALASLDAPAPLASLHVHSLYGQIGSVDFGQRYTAHNPDSPPLTMRAALGVLNALPPVALFMVKDSCTSFRPEAGLEGRDRDAAAAGRCTILDVFPVLIEHEPDPGNPWTALRWVTRLNGDLLGVTVYLERESWPAKAPVTRRDFRGGYKLETGALAPTGKLWIDKSVRWWAPDQSANRYTLYWEGLEWNGQEGADPTRTPAVVLAREILVQPDLLDA